MSDYRGAGLQRFHILHIIHDTFLRKIEVCIINFSGKLASVIHNNAISVINSIMCIY